MNKLLFILNKGVYPSIVGGMEIFNYYFIDNIKNKFDISYLSTLPLNIDGINWLKLYDIRPIKFFYPLQALSYLLINPRIKKVIISYSEAHWLVWFLYTLINTLLGRDYYVIIHHGKPASKNKYNIFKRFFQKAKKIIAVSDDIKYNYERMYNIKCELLYPLVPFENCEESKSNICDKYNIPKDANVISMIGSLKAMKNPDTLLDAISKMSKEELESYKLHIVYVGIGDMYLNLQDKSKYYGLEKIVHFLGFIPKHEINQIYKMSNIYVIASDFEGTSVSLLEAMYNKKNIIASDVPGLREMIKDSNNGLLFPLRDSNELKMKILKILDNPSYSYNLSLNAYNTYKNNYNYNDMINNYVKILS